MVSLSASVLRTALGTTLTENNVSNTVAMLEMNIETLLQAAEYIERREGGKAVVAPRWTCVLCPLNYRVAVLVM